VKSVTRNKGLGAAYFDLGGVDTYYTPPMSEAWSNPLSVEPLADERADIKLAIPLAEFPRVQARLGANDGEINGRVRFGRDGEFAVAALEVSGTVPLVCQRCLQLMSWKIDESALVALIAADSQADGVPEHLEPILAAGGKISLRDLFEEELLLGLPIVPLHADARECAPAVPAPVGQQSAVQRPFERLGELLKRGGEPSIAREESNHGRSKKS
jgi:uncharacterized protein